MLVLVLLVNRGSVNGGDSIRGSDGDSNQMKRCPIKVAPKTFSFNSITKTDLKDGPVGTSALKFGYRGWKSVGERCSSGRHVDTSFNEYRQYLSQV